jgi:hypothetical protein
MAERLFADLFRRAQCSLGLSPCDVESPTARAINQVQNERDDGTNDEQARKNHQGNQKLANEVDL